MSETDGMPMGLRERKKAETRAALSWAAIRLAVEKGFDNVKVEEIADAAGVSPRTYNNYFSSKGEAIVSRHFERAIRVAAELRGRPAAEPLWEAVKQAMLVPLDPGPEVLAHPVSDREDWAAGIRLMIDEPSVQAEFLRASALAEQELAAAIAERTGTDAKQDLYPKLVAAAVMAAGNAATRHWLDCEPATPMSQLLTEALDQIAKGLPTP